MLNLALNGAHCFPLRGASSVRIDQKTFYILFFQVVPHNPLGSHGLYFHTWSETVCESVHVRKRAHAKACVCESAHHRKRALGVAKRPRESHSAKPAARKPIFLEKGKNLG